jgi:tRNA-specific 2-thiouridylase
MEEDGDSVILTFSESQRALTPGQICGFYEGNVLVGGGVFEEILYRDNR